MLAEKLRVDVQPALTQAIETLCRLRLETALQHVRHTGVECATAEGLLLDELHLAKPYGMDHLPSFQMVQLERKDLYDRAIRHRVRETVARCKEEHDSKLILAAWKVAQDHGVQDVELQNLAEGVLEAEADRTRVRTELALPSNWKAGHALAGRLIAI